MRWLPGVLVLLAALLLLRSRGTVDVSLFITWMTRITERGMAGGYELNESVQPPVYAVIFWVVGQTATRLAVSQFIAYKVSLLAAWLLTGLCVRQWTRNPWVIAAIQLAFLPSCMALGYFDIYLAPLLLFALWAARERRWALCATSFTVCVLTKAQGLVLVPLAAVFAVKVVRRARTTDTALRVASALAAPSLLIVVLIALIFGRATITAAEVAARHPIVSANALNVGWILTHYVRWAHPHLYGGLLPDGTATLIRLPLDHPMLHLLRGAFFAVYGLILVRYARTALSLRALVLHAYLGTLAYCMLNAGVHENHLFYPSLLAIALYLIDRTYRWHALYWAAAANLNLVLFYGLSGTGPGFPRVVGVDLALIVASVNVLVFLLVLVRAMAAPGAGPAGARP